MTTEVIGSFVGTFSEAPNFNSVDALKSVLTIFVMVATLWVGGLLIILTCMAREDRDKRKKTMVLHKARIAVVS